jgi:diguanylate cyclase (GGDEF)-like protein
MTIQQRIIFFFSLIIALLIALVLLMWYRLSLQQQLTQAQENRYESYRLAVHLKSTADQLTRMARTYTLTADPRYKEYYEHILAIRNGTEPRPKNYNILFWDKVTIEHEFDPPKEGKAIPLLQLFKNLNIRPEEIATLKEAKTFADQLTELERDAFHLMDLASIDDSLSNVNRLTAQQLLHGAQYHRLKAEMMRRIDHFFTLIDRRTAAKVEEISRKSANIDRMMILLVLMLLFVALYSWLHSRRKIVDPLKELIHWTERLKEGNFHLSSKIQGRDEISQLAHSFTSMADTIHKSLNDLNIKANTDRLTGLPNRMYLEIEMERMHLAIKYYGIRCNIILMDIDRFKSINDRYGHDMGDQVLIRFAELLKERIMPPHVIGRWGGEEFLVLTKNLTLFETEELAESFRKAVEEASFPRGISITVSAGLAMIDANRDIRDALVRADKALYQAKASGRNRVELVAREMK